MQSRHFFATLLIVGTPVFAGNGHPGNDNAPTYCAYELGRLPGLPAGTMSLDVAGINEREQIIGTISVEGVDSNHAFLWDRRRGMRDLGAISGHASMVAAAINEAGAVVGDATDFESGESLAFVWTRSRGARTFDSALGGVSSFAADINRSGQIAGASETGTGTFHAFVRDTNGDLLDLGAFADGSGTSSATAINDRGQVVGTRVAGDVQDGFIWDERHGMRPLIPDATPSSIPFPADINGRGEVVGDMIGTEPQRAFRWTRSEGVQFLGTLTGDATHFATARAINRWGTIVGGSQSASGEVHGFVWNRRAGMRDLNELIDASTPLPLQPVLGAALGINDAGSIALVGFVPGEDSQRGYLLVPRRQHGSCR